MFPKFFSIHLSFKTFFRYKQCRNSQTPFTYRVVELKELVKVIPLTESRSLISFSPSASQERAKPPNVKQLINSETKGKPERST